MAEPLARRHCQRVSVFRPDSTHPFTARRNSLACRAASRAPTSRSRRSAASACATPTAPLSALSRTLASRVRTKPPSPNPCASESSPTSALRRRWRRESRSEHAIWSDRGLSNSAKRRRSPPAASSKATQSWEAFGRGVFRPLCPTRASCLPLARGSKRLRRSRHR